jgi:CO/xanthine dehydrogenase FAD-binding subunit
MHPGFRNPKTLADAIAILSDNPTWRPVAGGTDVLVQVHFGRLKSEGFVNVWGLVPRHIDERADGLHLGAGVTCTALADSPLVRSQLPALWEAARTMGSPQIRNRATLGGNAGNASPAADMVTALMVDEARVLVRNATGEVVVPLHRFFTAPGTTVLKPGDLVIELIVPKPPTASYVRFDKLGFRQAQVIAAVNFAVRATGASGAIDRIRITWGSVAPTPVRSHSVEGLLAGVTLSDTCIVEAVDALPSDISPIDDHRASAAYRTCVAKSFLRRALKECQTWLST